MIDKVVQRKLGEARFSILIPTWNSLAYLKLCIKSLAENSKFEHEIWVHVNEGSDGTLEWLDKQENINYTYSKENIGICWPLNRLASLARTNYIAYMNDDMYVCPKWDLFLWQEIESIPNNMFFLSSTLIQPFPFFCKSVISDKNYGVGVDDFREQDLLRDYEKLDHPDWCGATWPLNIVHKDIWNMVGGYSIEFSPGMYSDPDFSMKLWKAGVRYFKGISKSRVYHFESVSTKRIKKNKGSIQFLQKWGVTANFFTKKVLKRGEPFSGELKEPEHDFSFRLNKLRCKLKLLFVQKNTSF